MLDFSSEHHLFRKDFCLVFPLYDPCPYLWLIFQTTILQETN